MDITHRVVEANGLRVHLAEAGRGPQVCSATALGMDERLPEFLQDVG